MWERRLIDVASARTDEKAKAELVIEMVSKPLFWKDVAAVVSILRLLKLPRT